MILGVYFSDDIGTYSVFVKDVGGAYGSYRDFAVILLFAPGAQSLHKAMVRIGQQREWQLEL